MRGRFAAIDVRESLLFLSAHLSPSDVFECLGKVASFSCSKTAVQNIVDEMGEHLEEDEDDLMETVHVAEELPVAKTRVKTRGVAVSFNGDVPAEKPGKTSVKQAANSQGPKRLAGHVVARMPEDKFPTFRKKMEAEIRSTMGRIG